MIFLKITSHFNVSGFDNYSFAFNRIVNFLNIFIFILANPEFLLFLWYKIYYLGTNIHFILFLTFIYIMIIVAVVKSNNS